MSACERPLRQPEAIPSPRRPPSSHAAAARLPPLRMGDVLHPPPRPTAMEPPSDPHGHYLTLSRQPLSGDMKSPDRPPWPPSPSSSTTTSRSTQQFEMSPFSFPTRSTSGYALVGMPCPTMDHTFSTAEQTDPRAPAGAHQVVGPSQWGGVATESSGETRTQAPFWSQLLQPQRFAPPDAPILNNPRGHIPSRRLIIRQQPEIARACGFGERDRRIVDPPPILELQLSDDELAGVENEEHGSHVHIVHASLWNETGTQDVTTFEEPTKRNARRLVGTLVASGTIAKDEHSRKGCFFTLADLSCRTNGRYRLRFSLVRVDAQNMQPGACMPVIATALSDILTVYSPKEFPGMRQSTPLTTALKNQGVAVPAKKSKLGSARRDRSDSMDDEV